jgi:hypothetical protein
MRSTLLAGLALISLIACGGSKEQPAAAQPRPPAVKTHATKPKVKARATTPKGKKATPAPKAVRAAPAPEDTATPRNPLLSH